MSAMTVTISSGKQQANSRAKSDGFEPRKPGRPKGSVNKATKEVRDALRTTLPKAKRRLRELIESENEEIALKALSLTMAYSYGKPTEKRNEPHQLFLTLHTHPKADERLVLRIRGEEVPREQYELLENKDTGELHILKRDATWGDRLNAQVEYLPDRS